MWDLQHTPLKPRLPTRAQHKQLEMALIPYYEVDFKPNSTP